MVIALPVSTLLGIAVIVAVALGAYWQHQRSQKTTAAAKGRGGPRKKRGTASVPKPRATVAAVSMAAAVGRARGYEVATAKDQPSSVTLRWEPATSTVAIVFPLEVVVKGICATIVVLAVIIGAACHCRWGACRKEARAQEREEQPVAKAPKPPKQPKKVFCDAGVMGPVHYNGERYVHATQGFRRADEVTRVVASSGYRVPPGWAHMPRGGEAAKPHHE